MQLVVESDVFGAIGHEIGVFVGEVIRAAADGRAVSTVIENETAHDIVAEVRTGVEVIRPTGSRLFTFHISHAPAPDVDPDDAVRQELDAFRAAWPSCVDGPMARLFRGRREKTDLAWCVARAEAALVARKAGCDVLAPTCSERELEATYLLAMELFKGAPVVVRDAGGVGFITRRWREIEREEVQ